MFHLCSGCLRKSFGVETGEGSLPIVALLLVCSCCHENWQTQSHGMSHKTSGSTLILPISFESKSCSRQSRHQLLDAWNDAHSGMGTGRQWAEAVVRGEACATADGQPRTPHLELDFNTGNVLRSLPITAGQQSPRAGLSGGRKWSEGPWLSALQGYKHHPCLA